MARRSFMRVLLDSLSDAAKGGSWGAIGSTRKERELGQTALREVLGQVVDKYLEAINSEPRHNQYTDADLKVDVKSGWSRDYRCAVTDILVITRDGTRGRLHVIIDEKGNELYNNWHSS